MNQKNAKSLLDYVKADTPKYGPSDTDMGSGPGGAAATNLKYSRQSAEDSQIGIANKTNGLIGTQRKVGTIIQQGRSIDQMKMIRDIYNNAAKTVKKTKQTFRDI